MFPKRLILASSSPRRIALLRTLGYSFDIMPHSIEEHISRGVPSDELIMDIARQKADDVANKVDNAIIISADTVILHGKHILGKPKDRGDAKKMLLLLSDSVHEVITGVCLVDVPSRKKMLRIDRTRIKMCRITEEEIDAYVSTGEPLDKAGAYAIQGRGEKFIEKIEGSYSNVVGLPLEVLQEMLQHFITGANA